MEKINENSITQSHNISLIDRKNITICGIKKLNGFDEKEFFIDTIMGSLIIRGEKLELVSLDILSGKISIKGLIYSVMYLDTGSKIKKESIVSRLFKWVYICS